MADLGARLRCALLLFLLLLALPTTTASAQALQVAPAPAFVAPLELPTPRPERMRQIEGELYDLVHDTQVRVQGPDETTYRRRAYKIIGRSALEDGAQAQIDFDPSYEHVRLHHVRIIRDGRTLDLTRRVDVDILRKEGALDDGILTGVRTALIRLPDVRVGDIVDVAWSWVSRPPLWPGQYFSASQLAWSVPMGIVRFRLDLPAGQPLGVRRYRDAGPATLRRAGGRDVREWVATDPEPVALDADAPSWHRPWPRVAVSTMPSWRRVVEWALPLYRDPVFPSALAAPAARIEAEGGGDAAKAVKALRLVQDRIRYTSLSIGTGSYRPRDPATVVAQGWGDCKDKALLLVTLLRRLGIAAWPALTDIDQGIALGREIPSPHAFDHVVVLMRIGGRDIWVDPTIAHEGGDLAGLAPLPYRRALPIRRGQRELETIPFPAPAAPDMDVVERFRFAPAGMSLDVVTRYSGAQADSMRARLAGQSASATEAAYLAYYADDYAGLKIERPLAVADDRAFNRLVVRESYFLPASAYADGELLNAFPVHASALTQLYTYKSSGSRRDPMTLAWPVNRRHRILLVTPAMNVSSPGKERFEGPAFSFRRDVSRDGDTFTLDFRLSGKTPLLQAEDFKRFRKDADRVASQANWSLAIGSDVARDDDAMTVFVATFVVLVVLAGLGIRHARRADAVDDGSILYPVSPARLLLLSTATWGGYQAYWTWRNWRWLRRHESADILPFWRAVFLVFWLYPLFVAANGRAPDPLPRWIGVVSTILYAATLAGSSFAERLFPTSPLAFFSFLLAPLFGLPALFAVNRCNQPDKVREHERWGWLPVATLAAGFGSLIALWVEMI